MYRLCVAIKAPLVRAIDTKFPVWDVESLTVANRRVARAGALGPAGPRVQGPRVRNPPFPGIAGPLGSPVGGHVDSMHATSSYRIRPGALSPDNYKNPGSR